MIDEICVTMFEMRPVVELSGSEMTNITNMAGGARHDGVCLDTIKRKDLGGHLGITCHPWITT